MTIVIKQLKWLWTEFGLDSLKSTGRDAWLIILMRCCRMFAYGTTSLIMALFFNSLKFSDFQIGLFMSLTLLGDVLLSVGLTLVADGLGRRKILLAGACMMVVSGTIFALFENFWILLFAAVVGIISATGGDFGPFRAIEESTLSHLTNPKTRSDVLAWYITTASLGASLGTEVSGRLVDMLVTRYTITQAYHAIFWIYSAMGIVGIVLTLLLSSKCEMEKLPEEAEESEILLDDRNPKTRGDDDDDKGWNSTKQPAMPEKKKGFRDLFTEISPETRSIMYKLWFLLIIDSLADGMVPYSLTNYYLDQKFHLPKATLGDITSLSYLLASCSTIFAGPLARRLGLIPTMVFTHIPSSAAVLFFPLPSGIFMTVVLFFIRTGLNNMDQAPRSAFIAAVVKPEERTAVLGITSMVRTLASTTGPTVTGLLSGNGQFWIAFVAAGTLRLGYDFGLWSMLRHVTLFKHEEKDRVEKAVDPRSSSDEEELREM